MKQSNSSASGCPPEAICANRYCVPPCERLGELVYAPLAKYLTNVSHLIVCPDGQLSRVPFEMLRVGDRFLIEEKTISYVTSGREIVRLEEVRRLA